MAGATPLGLFIVTFLFVSITPGLCTILSLTLGMSIGVRRTMWMMLGELFGVGLVSIAAVVGADANSVELKPKPQCLASTTKGAFFNTPLPLRLIKLQPDPLVTVGRKAWQA